MGEKFPISTSIIQLSLLPNDVNFRKTIYIR